MLAGAYLIGAEAARDVGSIVARFRAEPRRAVAPSCLRLLALASGEGVVGPPSRRAGHLGEAAPTPPPAPPSSRAPVSADRTC